jgi:hypothetical protein
MNLNSRLTKLEARSAEAPQRTILYLPANGSESFDVEAAWEEFVRTGVSESAVICYPPSVDIHEFKRTQDRT